MYRREDLSCPSKRDTWCAIGIHRLLAPCSFKEEGLTPPSRESRSAEGVQSPGPQYRQEDLSHPSEADNCRAIRLLASLPLAALK